MAGLTDGGHTGVVCWVSQSLDRIGRRGIYTDGPVAEALKYSICADRISDERMPGPCTIFQPPPIEAIVERRGGVNVEGLQLDQGCATSLRVPIQFEAHLLSGDNRGAMPEKLTRPLPAATSCSPRLLLSLVCTLNAPWTI
jgi:hypothetical protein